MGRGKTGEQVERMKAAMREEDALLFEQERRNINMRVNTQATAREIDDIITRGGGSGEILNLISAKILCQTQKRGEA